MRRSELLFVFLLAACSARQQPEGDVRADVHRLRQLIRTDPARDQIAQVELVSDARPVYAAGLLSRGALVSAEHQAGRLEDARMHTSRGRSWARRLAEAYRQRVRGLRLWHEYLRNAASDDTQLLEATSIQRRSEVTILEVDEAMESAVPTMAPSN
jgi:hypothetical protein